MKQGQCIRKIRVAKGVTQWQLAQAAQVRPETIYLLERDALKPTEQLIKAIASALDVSISDITK